MYLQFRSSHACKKRIFALRHVIFRPATGYDSRNSGDVQMVSSIAFTWFMKFVFARSFYLVLFHIFFFFIFHDRWSYFIFHIYRNEFWNISIKCSSFKERHFDYINLMRQYEKKWKKWNAVNLYAIWNHLNMNKFCIKINWTMIWHIANILAKFVKKNLFKLFMKYTLNCLYSMNFIDNIISNNF